MSKYDCAECYAPIQRFPVDEISYKDRNFCSYRCREEFTTNAKHKEDCSFLNSVEKISELHIHSRGGRQEYDYSVEVDKDALTITESYGRNYNALTAKIEFNYCPECGNYLKGEN